MAHFIAAKKVRPNVDFIIDIGGQDIKCFKIRAGAIDNIYLNEACSSGCGSFLQTFAEALGMSIADFAEAGLFADHPVDIVPVKTAVGASVKQNAVVSGHIDLNHCVPCWYFAVQKQMGIHTGIGQRPFQCATFRSDCPGVQNLSASPCQRNRLIQPLAPAKDLPRSGGQCFAGGDKMRDRIYVIKIKGSDVQNFHSCKYSDLLMIAFIIADSKQKNKRKSILLQWKEKPWNCRGKSVFCIFCSRPSAPDAGNCWICVRKTARDWYSVR